MSFFTGDELNTDRKEGQESGFSHLFGAGCYNLQITFLLAKWTETIDVFLRS